MKSRNKFWQDCRKTY